MPRGLRGWHARRLAALVLRLRKTARHAVNVLLAAVPESPACRGVTIRLAEGPEEVVPLPGTRWARAAPGDIDRATRALLERLASRGRAHGPWRPRLRSPWRPSRVKVR